ncbi:hypothetical protein EDB80DRAFT_840177, partial [Ilyonectria destructans]
RTPRQGATRHLVVASSVWDQPGHLIAAPGLQIPLGLCLSEYNGSSLQLTDYWLRRPNLYRSVEQPPLRPDQELSQRHIPMGPILLRTVGRFDNTVDSSLLRTPVGIAPAVQRPGLSGAVAPLMPTSVRAGLRQQNGTAVVSVETRLSAPTCREAFSKAAEGDGGPYQLCPCPCPSPRGILGMQKQAGRNGTPVHWNGRMRQPVGTAHQHSPARPKFYRAAILFGSFTRGWARLRPIQAALGPLAATIRVQSSSMDDGAGRLRRGSPAERQLIEGLNFQPSARPTLREQPNRGGSSDSIRVLHRQYRRCVVTGLR